MIFDNLAPLQTASITDISDNVGAVQGVITNGGITNDFKPTINGTISAALATGDVVTIYRNGVAVGKAKVNATTKTWRFTPTLTSDGSYIFTASIVDAAGNKGPLSSAYTITLDTVAPTQTAAITALLDNVDPAQGPVAAGGRTNDPTPTISGTISTALNAGERLVLFNGTTALIDATVDNTTLTWTATPTLGSNGRYSIIARVVDQAGNQGPASVVRKLTLDTLAPLQTASITDISDNVGTVQGVIANGGITNDFKPTINGTISAALAAGDVVTIYRNGVAVGKAKVNATTKTWSFTPTLTSDGSYIFTASVVDAAGNKGPLSSVYTITLDTVAPTQTAAITLILDNLNPVQGPVAAGGRTNDPTPTISGTISTALNAGERLVLFNGTTALIDATVDNTTLTWTATPTLGSNGRYSIIARVVDQAGNQGPASVVRKFSLDNLAPTLSISSDKGTLKAGETANITFSFSKDPGSTFSWDGNIGDINVIGGRLSALSGTGLTRTAIFTPTAGSSGTALIAVTSGTYTDAAGNSGAGGSSAPISFDTLAPTLSVSSSASALKAGETATISFTFSEVPSGFTAADIATSGGSLSGLAVSTDPKIYTAIFTPTAGSSGTASIVVASGSYTDAVGNSGAGGSSAPISFDTLAPTLAISSSASALKAGETATISFTFSEVPSGFTAADITTSGGSLSSLAVSADPKIYTATFTPTAGSSGTALIAIASGTYTDAAGNSGAGGSSAPISFDTLSPTVAISSDKGTLKAGETATILFSFSEIPSGFDGSDITISGGSLSGLAVSTDPKIYTATFTPTAGSSGTASIVVASGSYTDAADNSGAGGSSMPISFDTLAPTLAISSSASTLKAGETATISFTFSEVPSGFTAADIATSGGSLSGLAVSTDPKIYTAIFTPTAGSSGNASITVASGSYSDATGNTGAGGSSAPISFDTLAPTLAISSSASTLKAGETATISFTFSEVPSGFTAADITTSGGSLSGLAVSTDPKIYTATFTPTAGSSGTALIAVASGTYTDAVGNSGAGGSSAPISFDTLSPTVAISSDKGTLKAGETATILFSFSEIPSGFDGSDITISGGSLSALSSTADPQVFSALFTPTAGAAGTASITIAAGSYSDAAGNSAVTSADLQINLESGLVSMSVGLSASSDTGTLGDGITSLSRVSLTGQGQGGVAVLLRGTALRAVIGGDGAFQLTEVPLTTGDNVLTLDLLDGNGNSVASRELPLTLEAPADGTSPEDPVLAWNRVALEAIRRDASLPPHATRALAMQSIAVLDTLAAIDGTPAFLVGLVAPAGVPAGAAVAAASARVLSYLYPSQKNLFLEKRDTDLQAYTDAAARQAAVELGEAVADVVIALRDNDGWDRFVVEDIGNQPGQWRPTPPAFDLPQAPHWAQLTPFSLQNGSQFRPDEPPALTSAAYAEALNEVKSLGSATSSTRTAEQTQIARFWADGLGSYTPPGHWNQIADQQATADGFGYGSAARLMAILNVALADSSIAAWDTKYAYDLWRPVTAIRNADSDGNPETTAQSDWQPLLITPNHPEYVSGHSTYSAAAAEVLTKILGDRAFDTTSIGLPGVSRSFSSFEDAAAEAGRSRIYGGIHYEFSNQIGQALGSEVAGWVLDAFRTDIDLRGPQLALQQASGQVWSNAPLLSGFAVDNLSGVKSLSVTLAGLDPKLLSVDGRGRFSLDVGALFGSLADGGYGLTFQAQDGAGNLSSPLEYSFQLDNTAPTLAITSLSDGGLLEAGARLIGSVDGTGTAVQSLSYRFNNGVARPLVFDSTTGAFDVPLSLGSLATGAQTLTITALDSAGLSTTTTLTLRLPEAIPLTIEAVSPADGTGEVGATFRPQVSFSRAVDPATVTGDSFWATDAAGNRLPATIVMAPQGNRAWLLFDGALPGSTRINLQLDGSKIRAAGDGQLLDADGDGTPGGSWNSAFTTVNLTPVAGTTLVGKVVGPGADLKPMSYDDFRAGPDGAAHTADDVFLEPLAGVKVFILGLEDRAVFTDEQGRFELKDVPVGVVKVAIDGRTATNPPTDVFYPEMVMDVTIRPAQVNTIMGTMGTTQEQLENFSRTEVYLPRISTKVLTAISPDQPTTVTTPEEGGSNLTEQQRELIQLVVQPGSVIGENGQVLDNAKVGIATVPPELVRDMLPPGLLQHTFDLTIQAPGAAVFSTPLQLTLPNVFNAAPGTKLNLLSFDHTTGRLVIDGTGTVSVDGEFVVTDPDSGITRPGWHGMTPPGSPTKGPTPSPPPPPCKPESGLDKAKFYSQLAKDLLKCASELTTGKIGKLLKVAAAVAECADEGLEIAKRVRDLSSAIDKGATQDAVLNTIGAIRGAKGVFEAKAPGVISDATSAINQAQAVLSCAALLTSQANEACKSAVNDIDCNPGTGTWGVARDLALKGLCSALAVLNSVVASFERAIGLASNEVGKFVVGALCEAVRAGLDGAEIWARNPLRANEILASLDAFSNTDAKQVFATELTQAELIQLLNDSAAMAFTIAADGSVGAAMAYEAASSIASNLDVFGYNGVVGHIGKLSQIILGLASRAPYLVEFDGVEIRGRTDEAGQIDVFLPPSTHFSLSIYNSTYNIVGRHEGKTSLSGTITVIQSIPYISSPEDADSDNDGLSDLAERILGSSLSKADTDSDGVSDMAEVQAGQDPLGGFSLPTGVVGSLALQGQALDLALATDPVNPSTRLALVATGSGISVVDLSNALSPSVVASLQLNRNADSVAYDPSTRLAAVALGNSLAILDLSTPAAPSLARTVAVAANQVEVLDGVAYVITGSSLQAYDLLTGDQRSSLSFSSGLTGLAREGSMLYLQDQSNRIHVVESVDGTGDLLLNRGSIALPYTVGSSGERKLFVAEGTLYVPADDGFQGGFATVDMKKPTAPVVLSEPDDRALAGKAIALTGSGRAVIVGNPGGVFGTNVADVINTSDPLNTGAFITRINMSARPNDVVIANGFAFVATDTGLQVVNFLPRDVNGIAPTLSIDTTGLDIDPTTPGLQVQDGSTIPLKLNLTDDVLVSSVDVLVNGQVVGSDNSYPFDLRTKLPSLAANGGSNVTLQVRATDTGGNIGFSDVISLTLSPDTIAPSIIERNVQNGDLVGRDFRSFRFTFSEGIELTAPVEEVFRLIPPLGATVTGTTVVFRNNGRQLQLTVDQLPTGAGYRLELDGSKIRDGAGNILGSSVQTTSFDVSSYDTITFGTTSSDNLQGGPTWDYISGGPRENQSSDIAADYLYGYAGDDALYGYGGYDYLYGGNGNDLLDLGADGGYANGDAGNDSLLGGDGSDYLYGGGGLDSLFGGAANDTLDDGDQAFEEPFYNPENGHWYQLFTSSSSLTWDEALATAAASRLGDRQGYLATITTPAEQAFLSKLFGNNSVWLGGSDAAEEGTWRWINGPENGSVFYVNGQETQPGYSNWSYGEPNNSGNEDALHWFSYSNFWNDLPPQYQYWQNLPLIEYGGLSTDGSSPVVLPPGDLLNGGAGDDAITSRGGNDSIDGGEGTDRLDLNLTMLSQDVILNLGDPTAPATLSTGSTVVNVESFSIRSGRGNDSIRTGAGNDNLYGGDGNDSLYGGAGYDNLYGEAGNDLLDLGDGDSYGNAGYADGGAGNDSLLGGNGSDNLQGGDGDDSLYGGAGYDNLYGGIGNDLLDLGVGNANGNGGYADGGAGNDQLLGGDGSDNLQGGGGLDSLYGGAGNDSLSDGDQSFEDPVYNPDNGHWYQYVQSSGSWSQARDAAALSRLGALGGYLVTITSAAEQAFITSAFANLYSTWIGASDADTQGSWTWVTGPEAGLVFSIEGSPPTGAYNNWQSGQPGDSGPSANRAMFLYFSNNAWYAVNDTYTNGYGYIVEYGAPGDSTALQPPGDLLVGGAGDDSINSRGGNDSIDGGEGTDRLDLNLTMLSQDVILDLSDLTAPATLSTGASVVNVESFSIRSGGGNDSIRTGAGNDNLYGGDGNDSLYGGAGYDNLYGEAGNDLLDLGDGDSYGNAGYADGGAGNDSLLGGNGSDNLQGGDGNDSLAGGAGSDYLYGGAGNDQLLGGDGSDNLQGGGGLDSLYGGAGDDTLTLDGAYGNDSLNGGPGYDNFYGYPVNALFVLGNGEGSDIGIGDGDGGYADAGYADGGAGDDQLLGGYGSDNLQGGDGNDMINGGMNSDWLTGGDGSDIFSYQNPNEGGDLITDFHGDFDTIQLSAAGFGGDLVAGMDLLASGRYVDSSTALATSGAGIGQFIYLTASNQLYWDDDGEGGLSAGLLMTFSNPVKWSASGLQVV